MIDEIENGLHYSTLQILWKTLLKALKVYHVQLFAAIHSHECIGALVSSGVIDKESERIRLYRIERYEDAHKAHLNILRK